MTKFDAIRPFTDQEAPEILKRITEDPMFQAVAAKLYPQPGAANQVLQLMQTIRSVEELQAKIIYPFLKNIEAASTKGISYSAMEQFNRNDNYLFISNHRDILLDPGFLNAVLHSNNIRKTEIAIGDNLLIYDWIKLLVRVNRAFIVRRNLGIREQLTASKELSEYIRHTLSLKGESIWIAQREGRTKDGNDQTQPALLKMLNMSNKKSMKEGFRELNIVPMAISYEIEPCGIAKVEELLKKKYDPEYSKTQQDDLKSMASGVLNPKGRVHFGFGNPLNIRLDEITEGKADNEIIAIIADYINRRIYFNYKLWPNNFIAADLLLNSYNHSPRYTNEDKTLFVSRMETELAPLPFDKDEARRMYLEMYANPVFNYEKYFSE
jgi:hypothetical protein